MQEITTGRRVLGLLDLLKPCNCDTLLQYRADVMLTNGDRHDNFLIGEIDVRRLCDVHYFHRNADILDMDNLTIVCENCKADWSSWNYLLDERCREALSQLGK